MSQAYLDRAQGVFAKQVLIIKAVIIRAMEFIYEPETSADKTMTIGLGLTESGGKKRLKSLKVA